MYDNKKHFLLYVYALVLNCVFVFSSCASSSPEQQTAAPSTPSPATSTINIDGNLNDWSEFDRLDLPPGAPVNGYKLYGRFENNQWLIAIEAENPTTTIGQNTTIWLNTDQDVNTGYQIFGFTGGAEYNVNIHSDNQPYLYTGAAAENYVTGPLTHARGNNGSGETLELAIPNALINNQAQPLHFVIDVNNTDFIPSFYTDENQYRIDIESNYPPRTDFSKKIAIIYSDTTANNFFDKKAYSQLYMSVQSQAMMAGIPFDLLKESDLTDLNNIINYDALVFPYFANVPQNLSAQIEENLSHAVTRYGISIITAGNFMTNNETGAVLSNDAYIRMKSLLGITRSHGAGPIDLIVQANNVMHPVMADYSANQQILSYSDIYTDYFIGHGSTPISILAKQNIGNATHNAVLASQKGANHIHFATMQFMADTNLLWPALQWAVYGNESAIELKLGRQESLFVSRNDMDQSMFPDEIPLVHVPLLDLLEQWKTDYNFVGSYYINIGNNPNRVDPEYTNWSVSGPLYQQYLAMGNEIGTHSYTHPHDTNILTPSQISFEFKDSRQEIETMLGLSDLGAAVPGAPENLAVANDIIQHVSYLTGGYSGTGAGFPNAIGYLTPDSNKVYLSPNMSFDFTNVQFLGFTAEQTTAIWAAEFEELSNKANQPIIHWPWHDYGPTISLSDGYSIEMFRDTIAMAYSAGTEFVTADDLRKRISSFRDAKLTLNRNANTVTANIVGNDLGRSSLKVADHENIQSVSNWYAYNDKHIFLDTDGGQFDIQLGSTPAAITHITDLPMRADLTSLNGDGENLNFSFKGEGDVKIKLACVVSPLVQGVDSYVQNNDELTLQLNTLTTHNVTIGLSCP